MTERIDSLLAQSLSATELSALHSTMVQVGPGRQVDAPSLLEGWREHVEKMRKDLDLPDSDRTVWGAHDLLAALSLRNFVRRAIDVLSSDVANLVNPLLAVIDEEFISYTEEDTSGMIAMVDELPGDSSHWWWGRIPVRGPIRRELERIAHSG